LSRRKRRKSVAKYIDPEEQKKLKDQYIKKNNASVNSGWQLGKKSSAPAAPAPKADYVKKKTTKSTRQAVIHVDFRKRKVLMIFYSSELVAANPQQENV
jgi:beta-lactamase superfamily II metal-dependent hydrolase